MLLIVSRCVFGRARHSTSKSRGSAGASKGLCPGLACLWEGARCSAKRATYLWRTSRETGKVQFPIHLFIYSINVCQALGRCWALF